MDDTRLYCGKFLCGFIELYLILPAVWKIRNNVVTTKKKSVA